VIRHAVVRNATDRRQAEAYLPANYEIVHEYETISGKPVFVIAGQDVAGWTLDDYVIPRYASGLIWCSEMTPTTALIEAAEAAKEVK
jgi:hypothetical protein